LPIFTIFRSITYFPAGELIFRVFPIVYLSQTKAKSPIETMGFLEFVAILMHINKLIVDIWKYFPKQKPYSYNCTVSKNIY